MEAHPFFTFLHAALIFVSFFIEFSFASDTMTLNQSIGDGETLVSSGHNFELGVFSPDHSNNRYLGIWYKIYPDTLVWVANNDNPITDSHGVLTFSKNGRLVLLNQTRSVIWSSNSSKVAENPVVRLLDSGNLLLADSTSKSTESYVWQSFDHLSNTLLPGMKLGWNLDTGLEQYLTSWKSINDPSTGDFTFKIKNDGLPQFVISMAAITKFRIVSWNGLRFNGIPFFSSPIFTLTSIFHENKFFVSFERFNNSVPVRVVLNQSGLLHLYVLRERSTEWALVYSLPHDPCHYYGQCGANGICKIYKSPICECLKGFTPKSLQEWEILDWSGGCTRRTPLDCRSGEGFAKVVRVKLPDLLDFRLNKSMNPEECNAECSKNCFCTAYAISDVNGSGCLMWFGDLIDVRELSEIENGEDIYIRLAASELESIHDSNKKKHLVTILVTSTISGMLILVFVLWHIIRKKRKNRKGEHWDLPLFDFATIATATNNFSSQNKLGVGGFGPVYKGNLPTGQEIAIKRLSKNSGQGLEEFTNEIVLIAKLQHRNLVRLLGCCIQREERMLIYEYMPNKSLDYFIFDQNSSMFLSWQKRFDIVMGIARGLLYLHQDSRLRIIHRDLKTRNILLDSNLIPKISDFGLARIFEGDQIYAVTKRVVGTYGYMSPEYAIDGTFSVKSDVFSFGVLLLEIVSSRKNKGFSHSDHQHNLLGHAWLMWKGNKTMEVIDARLEDSCVESQVLRCVQVGLLCVQKLPEDRPPMSTVVFMLGNEWVPLPQPKQPGFFTESGCMDSSTIPQNEESGTKNSVTITMPQGR